MIVGVGKSASARCKMNIATHNGIFHCDEVVGAAILEIAYEGTDIFVVRTRDPNELDKAKVVFDVGGGKFDHHMAGFDERRSTGVKYASAGLLWREFGEDAIKQIIGVFPESWSATKVEEKRSKSVRNGFFEIDASIIQEIKEQIDSGVIAPVDMEDNGEGTGSHMFSFISKFLPAWFDKSPHYDMCFMQAVLVVTDILKNFIKDRFVQIITKQEIEKLCEQSETGILEIPAQTMPWTDYVINYNKDHNNWIKFVIFPYPSGGWAAQCVPPSLDRKFDQLVPFPKRWAGGNEQTLPKVTGLKDATFCHNGRFFARAQSKDSVIEMCNVAMQEYES